MIDQSTWSINYNAILILFRDLSPEFLKGIDPEIIVEYFENASPTDLKESKQTNQNFSFSCQLFTLKKNMFESILVNIYMQGGQNVRIVRIIRIFYFVTLKLYGIYGLYGFFFQIVRIVILEIHRFFKYSLISANFHENFKKKFSSKWN